MGPYMARTYRPSVDSNMSGSMVVLMLWMRRVALRAVLSDCGAAQRGKQEGARLLVDLRAVMEAMLSRTSHGPCDTSRMPCSNACYLSQAAMRLAREACDAPPGDHSLSASALGDGNGVDHLVLSHHGVHCHLQNPTLLLSCSGLL